MTNITFLADRKKFGLPSARYAPGGPPMVKEFGYLLPFSKYGGSARKQVQSYKLAKKSVALSIRLSNNSILYSTFSDSTFSISTVLDPGADTLFKNGLANRDGKNHIWFLQVSLGNKINVYIPPSTENTVKNGYHVLRYQSF